MTCPKGFKKLKATVTLMILKQWRATKMTNKMKLNTKKSHILNIKGSIKANIGEKDLESVKCQRDLGLIIQQNLSWNGNCLSRSRKAMSALLKMKRNLSCSFDWKVKLNAYTGFVLPIAVCAS